jgi:hypothetical protein
MSSDKGKRFSYGSKLLSVVKEKDSAELYTALVGRGKGEEVGDGYGRRIGFEGVEWSVVNGDPVDKPLGQEFVELPEMTALYGFPDGEPRTNVAIFEDTEDETLLLQQTYEQLVNASRPQVQFKATVQLIGDVELGETVSIIRHDLNFKYKTRVFKIKRDLVNNKRTEVELGDRITESLGRIIKRIDTTNQRREERIIQYVQNTADGKNKIFRQETAPNTGMTVNDLWYKPVGEGEMEMYQWNGTIWELVVSTGMNAETNQAIDEAKGIAERARDHSNLLQLDADSILAGLGVARIAEVNQAIVADIQTNVKDRIDLLNADVGKLPTTDFVNQEVNRVEGSITTEIAKVTSNPKETIMGYNALVQTAEGNEQLIARIKTSPGTEIVGYQRIIEQADLYERVIGSSEIDINNNVARIVMSDSLFQTEVSDAISTMGTTVTQLADSWVLGIKSNDDLVTGINASSQGVRIFGENIVLDGNTIVDGTFTVTDTIFAPNMDISKFTVGTLDAANVNLINVNVNSLVGNTSEFIQSTWNSITTEISISADNGIQSIGANGDTVRFTQGEIEFQRGAQGRHLKYNPEGVILTPFTTNTGTSMNTSLHLRTIVNAAENYIHFEDPQFSHRIRQISSILNIDHSTAGELRIRDRSGADGTIRARIFSTRNGSDDVGNRIMMIGDRLQTPRDGLRDIYLSPNGQGKVRVANTNHDYYPIRAIDFENASSRKLKTNIEVFSGDALSVINNLRVVEYEMKRNVQEGVYDRQLGLISEDSPAVATSDGESILSYKVDAYLIKGMQELSAREANTNLLASAALVKAECVDEKVIRLEARVKELEQKLEEIA